MCCVLQWRTFSWLLSMEYTREWSKFLYLHSFRMVGKWPLIECQWYLCSCIHASGRPHFSTSAIYGIVLVVMWTTTTMLPCDFYIIVRLFTLYLHPQPTPTSTPLTSLALSTPTDTPTLINPTASIVSTAVGKTTYTIPVSVSELGERERGF